MGVGRWECGAYVTCAFENSAYVSVSFSLVFVVFVGLTTV